MTITQAAERLNVRRQRVSQLLAEGRLVGPRHGPGRQPPDALRVYAWSLDEEIARREAEASRAASAPAVVRASPAPTPPDATAAADFADAGILRELRELRRAVQRAERREEAARAALLSVKAAAEIARGDAARKRKQAMRVAQLLRDTANALADELDRDADGVAAAYADALTQLTAPMDAGAIEDEQA